MRPTIILKKGITGLRQNKLADFVAAACKAARLRGTVTVMVTDNREIRKLNRRFKGTNRATDVLSFPPCSFVRGFAGDIAVSADFAAKNARLLGHSVGNEVRILVLHGLLHLAGYDHETDNGEMASREQLLRARMSLPNGLIERSSYARGGSKASSGRV